MECGKGNSPLDESL
jgi:hypothetical protein